MRKNFLAGQKPTFIFNSFIFFLFFSHINKEKKWESGQKRLKPLINLHFCWPKTFLKVGRKPTFLAILSIFHYFFRKLFDQPKNFWPKVGRNWPRFLTPFPEAPKKGPQKGAFFASPETCFFRGKPIFSPIFTKKYQVFSSSVPSCNDT